MRMNTGVMFSSKTDQHPTPQAFFDRVNLEVGPFEVDVCADATNTKCQRFFSVADDGLAQDWAGLRCWMNPPYGREIGAWVEKAHDAAARGATVACLLPSRTDTAWFQRYCLPVIKGLIPGTWEFVKGRLKFGNATNSAPFPSLLIVFLPRPSALTDT